MQQTLVRNKVQIYLVVLLMVNSLFFIPGMMDLYLYSRFVSLSFILLAGGIIFYPDFRKLKSANFTYLDISILVFYLIHSLSVFQADNTGEAVLTTQKILLLFGVYYYLRLFLSKKNNKVIPTLIWANLALSIIVVSCSAFDLIDKVRVDGYNSEALYKVRLLMGNKTLLTEFIFYLLPLNIAGVMKIKPNWPFIAAIVAQLAMVALFATRSVWLVIFFTGSIFLVYSLYTPKFRKQFVRYILPAGILAGGLFMGALAYFGKLQAFFSKINPINWLASDTSVERGFMWNKTLLMIRENWLFGVGSGNWKVHFPKYGIEGVWRFEELNVFATRTHNDYLEIFAESGIFGLVAYLSIFAIVFYAGSKKLKTLKFAEGKFLFVMLMGVLGYCVIAFFDFPKERIEPHIMLGIYLAIISSICKPQLRIKKPVKPPGKWYPAFFIVLIALFAFNLHVGAYRIYGEQHLQKAIVAKVNQNWDASIQQSQAAYSKWFTLDPTVVPVKWYEGVGYFRLQQFEAALNTFQAAYEVNPYNFHVLNNLATSLSQLGRYEESIPYFREALRINPKFDDCKFNLAFTLYQIGQYEEARKWANETSDWNRKKVFLDQIDQKLK